MDKSEVAEKMLNECGLDFDFQVWDECLCQRESSSCSTCYDKLCDASSCIFVHLWLCGCVLVYLCNVASPYCIVDCCKLAGLIQMSRSSVRKICKTLNADFARQHLYPWKQDTHFFAQLEYLKNSIKYWFSPTPPPSHPFHFPFWQRQQKRRGVQRHS